MLGGDKGFNDKLCWVLVLPLAFMGLAAVDLAFFGLEVLFEGDDSGSATLWVAPLMSLCGGYAGVLLGAKVAPAHKERAAIVLSALYMGATVLSALARSAKGMSLPCLLLFVLLGAAGSGGAIYRARSLPPDDAEEPA